MFGIPAAEVEFDLVLSQTETRQKWTDCLPN